MDVLRCGVVHAAAAPGLGVQSGLKYAAEDGGGYLAPVKIGCLSHHRLYVRGEVRYLRLVPEQPPVDVREVQIVVGVPFGNRGVQNPEQIDQFSPQLLGRGPLDKADKGAALKYASVFAIEAEHQPDAKDVEGVQRLGRVVDIPLSESLIQLRYTETRIHIDLLVVFDTEVAGIDDHLQQLGISAEFLQ